MSAIERLQLWYASQCNGEWEHSHGVTIGTLDNPGWSVQIDLVGTSVAGRAMRPSRREGEHDWINCEVRDGRFCGHGGAGNLADILEYFLSWADD